MLRSDSSAISCNTVRTGISWKLKVTGLPVYFGGGAPVLSAVATGSAAALTGVTSTTYSLPVWYASAVNAAPVSITIREPPALGRDPTLRTGVAKRSDESRVGNECVSTGRSRGSPDH